MGFYAPAQLVRDAIEHGVEVRPADVEHSDWDCTLEYTASGEMGVRLGLRLIDGLAKELGCGSRRCGRVGSATSTASCVAPS